MRGENVQPNGMAFIRWIEHNYILPPLRGNDAENRIHKIAVRIENRHSFTTLDVLFDEIEKQRGLARAGCADDMGVTHPMLWREKDLASRSRVSVRAEKKSATSTEHFRRGIRPLCFASEFARGRCRGRREERHQLLHVEQHPATPALPV